MDVTFGTSKCKMQEDEQVDNVNKIGQYYNALIALICYKQEVNPYHAMATKLKSALNKIQQDKGSNYDCRH